VIASHYAEPLARTVAAPAQLRSAPADEADVLRDLRPGEPFDLLDSTLGWAWGYAGTERRVGYLRAELIKVP
jgi:hypothetical protein